MTNINDMPLISVIVPVYKVEPWLRRCVDSLLAQIFSNFELILVDDGSPDACGAICDEYAAADGRVRVIHKQNGGISDARNAGLDWVLANSCSRWLSFVDSDDWVHPQYLEKLYGIAESHSLSVVIGGFLRAERSALSYEEPDGSVLFASPEDCLSRHQELITRAWGGLFHIDLWKMVRFPTGKLCEDLFTMYKVIYTQKRIGFLPAPLYYYFQRSDSVMHSAWTPKRMEELEAFREANSYFRENGFRKSYELISARYLLVIARQIRWAGQERKKNRSEIRALKRLLKKEIMRLRGEADFSVPEIWLYSIDFHAAPLWDKLRYGFYSLRARSVRAAERHKNRIGI